MPNMPLAIVPTHLRNCWHAVLAKPMAGKAQSVVFDQASRPFALYLHWPFCKAKCPYCDFNSHVARRIDQQAWRAAYLSELRRAASETPDRVLRSIFFGGGTPSLMDPDTVAAVIAECRRLWP